MGVACARVTRSSRTNGCLRLQFNMTDSQALTLDKKLKDQLTCPICLCTFKDPKALQCFHVFCQECLQRLVVENKEGQSSLSCPTCRQSTLVPTTTGSLQPAFYIHHLFEIRDALEKVKEPQKSLCEKCKTPRPATNYCRDCGEFICVMCTTIHGEWDIFAKHEVVALKEFESKVKNLGALKRVTLYCPQHQDMKLDLYCETCEELICLHCTVSKHCRPEHKYDLVGDTFEKHKNELTLSLKPVEKQLSLVNEVLEKLDKQFQELMDLQVANEANIQKKIKQLEELLQIRNQQIEIKKKTLAAQKDEVETVQTQLVSCLSFVKESLMRGSQGEIIKMKKAVLKQIKEKTENFKPETLVPHVSSNIKFIPLPDITPACMQFSEHYLESSVCPEKSYASGKGLEVAEPDKNASAILNVVNCQENAHAGSVAITCELVSESSGKKVDCFVKKTEASQYEISYQATSRGRHQLHIKVEGEHIKGSPFSVTVKIPLRKLCNPIKTISRVSGPWGVAVNHKGDIIVAESGRLCTSVFSWEGKRLHSFSAWGFGHRIPSGVAVDDDGNILVTDSHNNCVQKFTVTGEVTTVSVESCSNPIGIAIHPHSKNVYVVDNDNHRIQVLNPDLTFSHHFRGNVNHPWGITFDSTGNVYIAENSSNRIRVFTTEGELLRQFGKKGKGDGELQNPNLICIDSDDVLYVTEWGNHRISMFTCEGEFISSFGTKGNEPGQFNQPRGIAVDKSGIVYVSDSKNNRLQIF